jgi:hypothetical protein
MSLVRPSRAQAILSLTSVNWNLQLTERWPELLATPNGPVRLRSQGCATTPKPVTAVLFLS